MSNDNLYVTLEIPMPMDEPETRTIHMLQQAMTIFQLELSDRDRARITRWFYDKYGSTDEEIADVTRDQ